MSKELRITYYGNKGLEIWQGKISTLLKTKPNIIILKSEEITEEMFVKDEQNFNLPLLHIQEIMNTTAKWSQDTFSDGKFSPARTLSMMYHLQEEVEETINEIKVFLTDPTVENYEAVTKEFADCFTLLFNSATNHGLNIVDIGNIMKEKLEINKTREWGEPDKMGIVKHIKNK